MLNDMKPNVHRSALVRCWSIGLMTLLLSTLVFACGSDDGPPALGLGGDCSQFGAEGCASGLCLRLDTRTAYCTLPCDVEEQDCPDGYLCQRTANPDGDHCVQRGAACNDDDDCPAGHRCDTSPGPGEGICYIPVSRELCAPCNSHQQCPEGGGCVRLSETTGEQFCTIPCGDGCPDGYSCVELPDLGEQCFPDRQTCDQGRSICSSCRGDAECGGYLDMCVQNLASGERFCAIDCEGPDGGPQDSVCPLNFSCIDLSGIHAGPWQCVPNASTCEGYCDADPNDVSLAEAQCGFGRMCDPDTNTCLDADDGRLCAPCADDDDCRKMGEASVGNLCMANRHTGETFCGTPCGEVEGGEEGEVRECPLGFSCVEVEALGEAMHQCLPTRGTCRAGTGRLGDGCGSEGAMDCLSGICLDFGPVALCSARCTTDEDCGAGGHNYQCCWISPDRKEFDCGQEPEDEGVCAPVGGQFGDDCAPGRAPCRSGLCLDIGTARLCTQDCEVDEDCPENFVCQTGQSTHPERDEINICFPEGGGVVGADCTFGPAACGSRLCISVDFGGENVCTVPCGEDGSCPVVGEREEQWVCDENAETVDDEEMAVCVPPALAPVN